jgi:DNA mismatch repair protein MutS
LNELANHYPTVKNYHIATKEIDGNIVFLRKLTPGGVASSFGIHVARLAGMPREVIASAEAKLRRLTQDSEQQKQNTRALREESVAPVQLSLYQLDDPLLLDIKSIIEGIDLDSTSPLEAFDTIRSIKQKLSGGQKRANSKRT